MLRLNRDWAGHSSLFRLLKALNAHLRDYGDMAEAYRGDRDKGRHTYTWRLNRKRREQERTAMEQAERITPKAIDTNADG